MIGDSYLVTDINSGASVLTKYDSQISYMPIFFDKKFADLIANSWNKKNNCSNFVVKKFSQEIFLKQEKELHESGIQLFIYPATEQMPSAGECLND